MKLSAAVKLSMMIAIITILIGFACGAKSELQPGNDKILQSQSQGIQPEKFAIISPKTNAQVDRDVITVHGIGAHPNTTVVEIDVFADGWYPQSGAAQIGQDGNWAYSPCYLKGQGSFRLHHNIRARLMQNGQQIAITAVYNIAVQ
jgi:hypothetical protein